MPQSLIYRSSFILGLSVLFALSTGCDSVYIQDRVGCAFAGTFEAGAICGHMRAGDTCDLSLDEMLDFMQAQPNARLCVTKCGLPVCADDQTVGKAVNLAPRGAAIAMSSLDWGGLKTDLETACRVLGDKCSYEVKKAISTLGKISTPK